MSRRDVWETRDVVLRYRAFCDEIRLKGALLPHQYRVDFVLPMPPGWPEEFKVLMDGQPCLLKPDTSNLVKALEDALVRDDERLFNIGATKHWGRRGLITIHNVGRTNP